MPKPKTSRHSILSTERAARKIQEMIEETRPGKHNNVQQRVQDVPEVRIDPMYQKSKEEGEAELEALREKQRKRKQK